MRKSYIFVVIMVTTKNKSIQLFSLYSGFSQAYSFFSFHGVDVFSRKNRYIINVIENVLAKSLRSCMSVERNSWSCKISHIV